MNLVVNSRDATSRSVAVFKTAARSYNSIIISSWMCHARLRPALPSPSPIFYAALRLFWRAPQGSYAAALFDRQPMLLGDHRQQTHANRVRELQSPDPVSRPLLSMRQ
jgi:hypothetical protein